MCKWPDEARADACGLEIGSIIKDDDGNLVRLNKTGSINIVRIGEHRYSVVNPDDIEDVTTHHVPGWFALLRVPSDLDKSVVLAGISEENRPEVVYDPLPVENEDGELVYPERPGIEVMPNRVIS